MIDSVELRGVSVCFYRSYNIVEAMNGITDLITNFRDFIGLKHLKT